MSNHDDMDDLDAILDDAINTMSEEEHRHEEQVRARDAARALEQKDAAALGGEAEMVQMLQSLMGGENAGSMEEMIQNFKSQVSGMANALDNLPNMTDEERAQLGEVRQLIARLDETAENVPADGPAATDEDVAEALQRCMGELQNMNLEGNTGDTAAGKEAEGAPSMENVLKMFFNVVFDPQLGIALHMMRDSYPPWFAANEATTNAENLERYRKQYETSKTICDMLDDGPLLSEEDPRVVPVIDLLQKLAEYSPPPENLSEYLPARPETSPSDIPTQSK